jgi:ribose transport system ATP-binding protein
MIYGISSIKKGNIYLDGQMVENIKPYIMVQKRVAYVPEDRHIEGLLMSRSIEENITLPSLKKWSNFLIKKSRLNHIANKAADIARIKRSSIEDTPRSLSGGNQQKVVIARWLTKYYDYFLLSEPFKGIDVGAKRRYKKNIN